MSVPESVAAFYDRRPRACNYVGPFAQIHNPIHIIVAVPSLLFPFHPSTLNLPDHRRPRLSHNVCACQIVCETARTEYLYAVLCEICQKRHANVHESTTILRGHPPNRTSTVSPTRHLCAVCAGHKTEEAWDAEQKERAAASRQRLEQSKAFSRTIREELFESRRDLMMRNQIRVYGMAVDHHWKIALLRVGSLLAEVDPLNVLSGPIKNGANHVVQQLRD